MGNNGNSRQNGQKATKKKIVKARTKTRRETRSVMEVRQAVMASRGNLSRASQALGFQSRQTVHDYIKRHPSLEKTVEIARNFDLDVTENQLDKLCQAGKASAIIFKLKCKGKARGWVETIDLRGNIGIKTVADMTREAMEERRKDGKRNGGNGHTTQEGLEILSSL